MFLEHPVNTFNLVATKRECSGAKQNMGFFKTVELCAHACGRYEMFAFGSGSKCNNDGWCSCECQKETTNHKCNTQIENNELSLYAFQGNLDF